MTATLDITAMTEGDLDQVIAIQKSAELTGWPRQLFVSELAREWAYLDVAREPGAPDGQEVVGFSNYWLVHDELHLLNIAIRPDRRRRGYARRLLDHMLDFARERGCQLVVLEVRKSNHPAIELYRSYGFTAIGLRARYYAEDDEDALVMSLDL